MPFSRKIFLSIFFTTLILGSTIIWASHRYIIHQSEQKFVSRYSVFTRILANTLTRLDLSTEALMHNAAKVVVAEDAERGLLSEKKLKSMRDDLNMTHIFIINSKGKFIRSTNEAPSLIPNLFSFCSKYRGLITGKTSVEATPVIKPDPEPKPYKFLSIPTRNHKRIVEVGVRVDFIAKTLVEAMSSDKNVLSMSLYGPDGTSFGQFSSNKVVFGGKKVSLPEKLNTVVDAGNDYNFYAKVASSHTKCCQCEVSGISKNGQYYYVLEAKVSKKELNVIKAATTRNFAILAIINLLLSLILSRLISRRLVRNIEKAAKKVKKITRLGDVKGRINHKGKDEVAFLTGEFDRLLDKLEDSQNKIIESEKIEAKVQLAKQVAHNIRSPILAIEMMLPTMINLPERMKTVLNNSVKEIKALSDRLKNHADTFSTENNEIETLFLPIILQDIVSQKQLEYSDRKEIAIRFTDESNCKDAYIKVCSVEFKSILSNLVNNAVESYGAHGGPVDVKLSCDSVSCSILIVDQGVGIPNEFLVDLGKKQISFKGKLGRGLGLTHAYDTIQSWGGEIKIESKVGFGTTVKIQMQKMNTRVPHIFKGSDDINTKSLG